MTPRYLDKGRKRSSLFAGRERVELLIELFERWFENLFKHHCPSSHWHTASYAAKHTHMPTLIPPLLQKNSFMISSLLSLHLITCSLTPDRSLPATFTFLLPVTSHFCSFCGMFPTQWYDQLWQFLRRYWACISHIWKAKCPSIAYQYIVIAYWWLDQWPNSLDCGTLQ